MGLKKIVIIFLSSFILLSCSKAMPRGTSIESKSYKTKEPEFIYDLTFEKDGEIIKKQQIWDRVFTLIDEAEEFIIMDMFLYNNEYDKKYSYPTLAEDLTNALIKAKKEKAEMEIIMISDEVNIFYGAYKSELFERLQANGISVIVTDMTKLPDSNFVYSFMWRTMFQWFGTEGKGWLRNPFNPDGPKVTLRSYLKLINFKANHRKVAITENGAFIMSSNPHDASANHSNIAFFIDGEAVNTLIKSELAVIEFSDEKLKKDESSYLVKENNNGNIDVKIITEGKIKKNILKVIRKLGEKDKLDIGVFYLSDREVIKALLKAADRGVDIRMILDANKDAFGLKKNGVPNRPVAVELKNKSDGQIKIKWYRTNGEQFHTKLLFAKMENESVIIGGSANFTRRNIDDYNLETNVMIRAENDKELVKKVENYFDMLWYNKGGIFTVDLEEYYDESIFKKGLYRFQEWSGVATY